METALVVGIISAVVAITGWFVVAYLNRRQAERMHLMQQKAAEEARRIAQEETAKIQIQDVLSACNRRAVFGSMATEIDDAAMFESLAACRSELQKISPYVQHENQQRLIVDIIAKLDYIERRKSDFFAKDAEMARSPGASDAYSEQLMIGEEIDTVKRNIIGNLKELCRLASVAYVLPQDLRDDEFRNVEQANEPA